MAIAEKRFLTGPEPAVIARKIGWHKHRVIGAVVCFWDTTQDKEILDGTREELANLIEADTDDEALRLIDAMILVDLLPEADSGKRRIRGNKKHIERIQKLRDSASKGGKERIRRHGNIRPQANDKHVLERATSTPSADLSVASASVSVSKDLRSSILDPVQDRAEIVARLAASADNLASVEAAPKKRKKSSRTPEQQDASRRVSRLVKSLHTQRYLVPPIFGAEEYAKIARWVDARGEETCLAVARQFYASKDPYYVRMGHPVGLMIEQSPKLWAEANNPDHHRLSGVVREADTRKSRDEVDRIEYEKIKQDTRNTLAMMNAARYPQLAIAGAAR